MNWTCAALAVGALLVAGCGKEEPKAQPSGTTGANASPSPAGGTSIPALEDRSAEVKTAIEAGLAAEKAGGDAVEKWFADLILPGDEAWFRRVFGEDKARKLSEEYAGKKGDAKIFQQVLHDQNAKGATEVRVSRMTSATDTAATSSAQKAALSAMKEPTPLYKVEFFKPGDAKANGNLWSFVWADGKVRWVSSMRALKD